MKPEVTLIIFFIILFTALLVFARPRGGTQAESKRFKRQIDNIGENRVRRELVRFCRNSSSHVLNNVTLPYADGTTQIDHILITQHGILVIETKHYSGWIFASQSGKQWTQVLYKVRNTFLNPLFQNKKHIRAVRQLLDFLPPNTIQGLVVFSGSAEFKTTVPDGVVYFEGLSSHLKLMNSGPISENRVHFCVGRLECKRFELTEKTDVEHHAYLERKFGKL